MDTSSEELTVIPTPLRMVNEALAFLLELVALGLLAWWGFHTGSGLAVHLLLGLGAPALMAVTWGLWAAPRAKHRVPLPLVILYKVLVFGLTGVAAYVTVGHTAGIAFAVVALLNTALATADRETLLRRSAAARQD